MRPLRFRHDQLPALRARNRSGTCRTDQRSGAWRLPSRSVHHPRPRPGSRSATRTASRHRARPARSGATCISAARTRRIPGAGCPASPSIQGARGRPHAAGHRTGCDRPGRAAHRAHGAVTGARQKGRGLMTAGVQQFLPWQTAFASRWLHAPQRFAHAWLIHGLAGIGKRRFALAAAASLLCEQPRDGLACNTCQACRWVAGGNHPDLRRVRPEAVALEEGEGGEESESAARKTPSREIRVEQIRSLSGWFGTATHRGGWGVAVLYPAHAMNLIAANALLKVLEEPPPHTVFLLVTDTPDQLLPTIVSRCRRLPLPVPEPQVAAQWLREQGIEEPADWLSVAGGAPVRALELARSDRK